MKLVMVEWEDSCSGHGWMGRDVGWYIERVVSVGILISEDEEKIELIPNISSPNKLHQIAIPKGCIKRIRRIKIK